MTLLEQLQATKPATDARPVTIPAGNGKTITLYARTLTCAEADHANDLKAEHNLPAMAAWITVGIGDQMGKRAFTDDDIDEVARLPVSVGKILCAAVLEFNGLATEEITEANAGNSSSQANAST